MSQSTRDHDQPIWARIKMIAASRAHRAMKKYGRLKLGTNLCPQVDEKVEAFKQGEITLAELRRWLGQVHTDYVSTLDQTQEKLIKLRIRHREQDRDYGALRKAFQAYNAAIIRVAEKEEPAWDGESPVFVKSDDLDTLYEAMLTAMQKDKDDL